VLPVSPDRLLCDMTDRCLKGPIPLLVVLFDVEAKLQEDVVHRHTEVRPFRSGPKNQNLSQLQ
jgi:hypothetical protein